MITRILIKGIKRYQSKGTWYYYHRKTNTRLEAPFGTAAFIAEVATLDAKVAKIEAKPGTLEAVIARYKASEFWTGLSASTRLSYDRAIDRMKNIQAMPLRKMDQEFVAGVRDKINARHGRWMANYVLTVLSILLDTALENGWVPSNPAKGVRRIKKDRQRPKANRPWDPQECRTVLDAAPPYLRVPIALAMFGGFRKGDVLTITKDRVVGDRVKHRTQKTGREVSIPLHPTLANALAGAPPHDAATLAANSRGKPWTESGFNSTFSKLIGSLEADGRVRPGLTMHGLRHTLATRLVEGGADRRTVKEVLGQTTDAMADHYSEEADRSETTDAAFGNLHILDVKPRKSGARIRRRKRLDILPLNH